MTFTFPLNAVLPDGRKLIIDHMTSGEITEMFRMIMQAARTGSGFGEDEYIDEEDFRFEVRHGDKFVFKDKSTQKVVACLALNPSNDFRSMSIKDAILVVSESERGKNVSLFCGMFAIDYCASRGYDGIIVDMFKTNFAGIKTIKRLGLKKVGGLNISGKVKGHGYVGTEFYFCDLRGKNILKNLHFVGDEVYSTPLSKL